MSNFSIKVDLLKFAGAKVVTVKGEQAILIPTELNQELFVGQKGAYMNLTAIELKEPSQYGDTHFIKGNLPRDVFDKMSEEERRSQPILGNMRALDAQKKAAPAVSASKAEEVEVEDDLPF